MLSYRDWRPSFILAYVILTAVVASLHADDLFGDGFQGYTISLVIMSAVLVGLHLKFRAKKS